MSNSVDASESLWIILFKYGELFYASFSTSIEPFLNAVLEPF